LSKKDLTSYLPYSSFVTPSVKLLSLIIFPILALSSFGVILNPRDPRRLFPTYFKALPVPCPALPIAVKPAITTSPSPPSNLSLSSKYLGEVEIIQIALSFLGFGSISNTGHYDEKTAEAIEMFQSQNQLKVNGRADKNTLIELLWELKGKGFEDDDLAKFIKSLDIAEKEYPIDSYNLEDYCDKVIDNFEGGYANEAHFKDAAKNEADPDMKAALENSSETMFGMDRMAGNWDSDPVGSDFWQLVDENSGWAPESAGKPKWSHGYMGGSIEGQLRSYVYEMMIPRFKSLKDQYLSSESKKLVEEDKRLTMHLLYAVWNGSGFFQDFADVIDSEVSSGNTDRDSLYEVAIDSRVHNGNGAIAKVGNKVKNVIDSL